jgi:hypothetical protein
MVTLLQSKWMFGTRRPVLRLIKLKRLVCLTHGGSPPYSVSGQAIRPPHQFHQGFWPALVTVQFSSMASSPSLLPLPCALWGPCWFYCVRGARKLPHFLLKKRLIVDHPRSTEYVRGQKQIPINATLLCLVRIARGRMGSSRKLGQTPTLSSPKSSRELTPDWFNGLTHPFELVWWTWDTTMKNAKKPLVTLVVAGSCWVAHAQGLVDFSNHSPGGLVNAPV